MSILAKSFEEFGHFRLKKKEKGGSIFHLRNEKKMWSITKLYDNEEFNPDESSLGYKIDVYQESINKSFVEYLVNFDYFTTLMINYGFVLLSKEEAIKVGLPSSIGSFSELYGLMNQEIKSRRLKKTEIGGAADMTEEEKDISPITAESRDNNDYALRPQRLKHFIGQTLLCNNLNIFMKAAQKREEALDHVLLYGPPGLGKTTLAKIIANELDVGFRSTSGPVIQRPGDLAALLTSLEKNDILFIDEIHRLNNTVEEILYPAMEDLHLDIMIGEGPSARSVKIDLQPFTLIGATTRAGLLSNLHFFICGELDKGREQKQSAV